MSERRLNPSAKERESQLVEAVERLANEKEQLLREPEADALLLRWAASYLIPGEGKADLIRAIHKRLGITGHVTDL